jgi:hypothetical protein
VIRVLFIWLGCLGFLWSQNDLKVKPADSIQINSKSVTINPLAPSKAAFYSALVPGLGQAYNKRYWKIPIVYGAIGTGVGIYVWNDQRYDRYRSAYKQRLEGQPDEFLGIYSDQILINAQRQFQRNRDLALIATIGLYVLNIVDANVDAHLKQFNVDQNLSLRPDILWNPIDLQPQIGITLTWNLEKKRNITEIK